MFDIGVNLLHPQFDEDRQAVLDRARRAGLTGMLITCTELNMVSDAIRLCDSVGQTSDVYCTAGVHPHDAKDAPADLSTQLLAMADSDRVRAIGEMGLDFNRNFSPPDVQRQVFQTQLELAASTGLPAFVHDRDSDGAVYRMLADCRSTLSGAVVHCFTGTAADLERYLALDVHIGITGWVCDRRRGGPLRDLISRIPLDRLLIETDAPFLVPHTVASDWHTSNAPGQSRRRNEPALLGLVADEIARQIGTTSLEVQQQTQANARRLFRIG